MGAGGGGDPVSARGTSRAKASSVKGCNDSPLEQGIVLQKPPKDHLMFCLWDTLACWERQLWATRQKLEKSWQSRPPLVQLLAFSGFSQSMPE
jgi:hypothetical protein